MIDRSLKNVIPERAYRTLEDMDRKMADMAKELAALRESSSRSNAQIARQSSDISGLIGARSQAVIGQDVSDPSLPGTLVGGTVTSVAASGGTTGFGFSGTPFTTTGTLTLTLTIAAGAIPFGNAGGNGLATDSSNLRYDDTNNQLKVGAIGASIPGAATAQVVAEIGVGAVSGNKIVYLFNNGTTLGLYAYDYSVPGGIDLAFGGNGGNRLIPSLPVYANNAAAVAGGLTAGMLYRDNADPDHVCVTH